ncbi:MAG: hypothetical protein FWG09_05840 [Synergistaceae bacterium]|nr:hypothetical protein [Synergistaceae bacterium]
MSEELKKSSLVDVQIRINTILYWTIFPILFVIAIFSAQSVFSRYIFIVFGLFLANWPFLRFAVGIRLDKGWILSIMGIEDDHVIPESKAKELANSSPLLWGLLLLMMCLERSSLMPTLNLIGIVLLIFSMSRMITQVLGFYIYWIARINNDPKLKANAPDGIILERSIETANLNYRGAGILVWLLLVSLAAFSALFWLVASARTGFILYAVLIFSFIVLIFIPGLIFDKNAILLHIIRSELFDEQCAAIKDSMQKRLFFMKCLLALFLLMEVIILPVIVGAFL